MSQVIITLAQFIFILWPVFIVTALVYSLQITPSSSKKRPKLGRAFRGWLDRTRRNLLLTWAVLVFFWLITRLAEGQTPGLLPDPWNTILFLGGFLLLLVSEAHELGVFKRRLRAHVDFHHTRDIQDLKRMDPGDFEILVTEMYRSLGYRVQHNGKSGDHGIDIELRTKTGEYWVVQCKRYQGSVGEGIVRELFGTLVSEKADRGVMVTTARITPPARAWARGKPIDLIDGPALLFLIQRARRLSEGSLIDRLALMLEDFLQPSRPPGLRVAKSNGGEEEAAPNGSPQAAPKIIYLRGAPVCPECGVPMKVRPPRPGDRPGRILYRCQNYPDCRVVLERQPNLTEPLQQDESGG